MPTDIDDTYIKELYQGFIAGSQGAEIIGGDITGGESVIISITAIGVTLDRKISSRKTVVTYR